MLLPVVIILGTVRPDVLGEVNKRELMEGTLQKYVEEFMAFYGKNGNYTAHRAVVRSVSSY